MTFTVEKIEKTAERVAQLADAIPKGNMSEFTMRVPAEPDRYADLVLAVAAQQLLDYAELKRRDSEAVPAKCACGDQSAKGVRHRSDGPCYLEENGVDYKPPSQPSTGVLEEYREIARLIGQIFYYGNFKAETWNERELEALLRKTGNFITTQEQADEAAPRSP